MQHKKEIKKDRNNKNMIIKNKMIKSKKKNNYKMMKRKRGRKYPRVYCLLSLSL
jgi:hypothetical protein